MKDLTLSYHAVAYIDILGQRSRLEKLSDLDLSDNKDKEKLVEAVRNSIAVVVLFRKTFGDYFRTFSKIELPASRQNQNSKRSELLAWARSSIEIQAISDTLIISVSFDPKKNRIPIVGVRAMLFGCAATFIDFLALGHPFRGGIEIGTAADLQKGGIYGPILGKASCLEKEAKHPRIVVGKKLEQYLEQMRHGFVEDVVPGTKQQLVDAVADVNKQYAERCIELIAKDTDDQAMIDYLGHGFRKYIGDAAKPQVEKAHKFVLDSAKQYKEEQNSKLSSYYDHTANYFRSRIQLWQ